MRKFSSAGTLVKPKPALLVNSAPASTVVGEEHEGPVLEALEEPDAGVRRARIGHRGECMALASGRSTASASPNQHLNLAKGSGSASASRARMYSCLRSAMFMACRGEF